MIESRDILNYSLTASVLVLTFFIAWILLYFVKIFREIERVMRDIVNTIEKLNKVLDFARDKISSAASVIPLVIKGGEKIIDMVSSIRERRSSSSTSKKKKNKTEQGADETS